ncbi:hypothetical protein [Marinirhabdus gelatinilytica]|uniref:DUF4258 domain-containing protein n=1 Tax=Marinirhabdus gelatinilytica TaxID=1703343 RepID=A0A370Q5B9_9FLAO|nr:hypothetical protein [Marinirhabdus gelatinilytica]RDK83489.1 hypothetical protein C8D94_10726 [Marinirhabdus gelatinilytica]
MKLIQRIAYYGVGFIIGLIILFFFLGGKKTSCDYGFDARTLKNIRTKQIVFTAETEALQKQFQLDTAAVRTILKKGDVDFSETDRDLDSCKIYLVNGEVHEQYLQLRIQNCTKTAKVLGIREIKD